MALELKSISEEEVARLAEIFHACLQVDYVGVLPPDVLEAFTFEDARLLWQKSFANQANCQFLGAWSGGDLLGFAKFGRDPEDSDNGYLASLYVDPKDSGKGVGRLLLGHVLDALSIYSQTRLWVFANNPRAIRLYESLGFMASGRTRVEEEWKVLQCQLVLDNSKAN